jgi:putative cell wall-binding protein
LGTTFPDALAAGPLAARAHAPQLLTAPGSVPPDTAAAAAALTPREITVVGGPAAIPDAVAAQVGGPGGPGTVLRRLGGANRFDTAALAAQAAVDAGADGDVVLVAAGHTFADALGAGPAVAAEGGVLLLTEPDALAPATRDWVGARTDTLDWLRVAGGPAAVSDAVVHALLQAAGRA